MTELQRCSALGFRHHVFISWPHDIEDGGRILAYALKEGLEDKFKSYGRGSVYLDDRVEVGSRWDREIRTNLCRSAVTICLIAPTFFFSSYCCTEWAIAERLQAQRFNGPSSNVSGFLPVLFTGGIKIPHEVAELQVVTDFLPMLAHSKRVNRHPSWDRTLERLRTQIFRILATLRDSAPNWESDETLSLSIEAKRFRWQPPAFAPTLVSRRPGGFPTFQVEARK